MSETHASSLHVFTSYLACFAFDLVEPCLSGLDVGSVKIYYGQSCGAVNGCPTKVCHVIKDGCVRDLGMSEGLKGFVISSVVSPSFSSPFSRMRSEGFKFYSLGVWGLTHVRVTLLLVSAILCNRLQPSVHDRRWTKAGVSMGEATKTCLYRRVRRCAHVVLRGRRGAL